MLHWCARICVCYMCHMCYMFVRINVAFSLDCVNLERQKGPCERCVRKAGNDICPDYSKNHIHDRDSTDLNGMHALSGNPQRISVFAEACIVVVVVVGCI